LNSYLLQECSNSIHIYINNTKNDVILYPFIVGLMAGILSTAAMTATEIPSWKRWGIYGVFEWHENYIITKRLHRRFSNTIEKGVKNHFKGIFFFHFLNGALAAIAFPYVITFLIPSFSFNILSFCLFGVLYVFHYGLLLLCLSINPSRGIPYGNIH
jgi:hypothetical protein